MNILQHRVVRAVPWHAVLFVLLNVVILTWFRPLTQAALIANLVGYVIGVVLFNLTRQR